MDETDYLLLPPRDLFLEPSYKENPKYLDGNRKPTPLYRRIWSLEGKLVDGTITVDELTELKDYKKWK